MEIKTDLNMYVEVLNLVRIIALVYLNDANFVFLSVNKVISDKRQNVFNLKAEHFGLIKYY